MSIAPECSPQEESTNGGRWWPDFCVGVGGGRGLGGWAALQFVDGGARGMGAAAQGGGGGDGESDLASSRGNWLTGRTNCGGRAAVMASAWQDGGGELHVERDTR